MIRHKGIVAAAVAVALGVAAAGCGGDDSKGGSDQTGIKAGSGDVAAKAATAGEAAAKEAGAPTTLSKDKTIGFLQIVAGIESADRVYHSMQKAAKQLGWKAIICDGQGNPQKMATCGDTLLGRGVDAIVTDIGDASLMANAMRNAKSKGIPVIDVSGEAVGFDANYAPDEARLGKLLADYAVKQLTPLPDNPVQIATSTFPQPFAMQRTDQLKAAVKANPKLKIVANASVDPANVVEGSRKVVRDQLTAHPDLKMIWADFDTAGQAIGQQVATQFPGKTFPDKPMVATFHADLGTSDLIRNGAIDVVADVAYDTASFIGIDQLAELFARKTPLSKEVRPQYPGGVGDLYTYKIVTKDNVPAEGQYVEAQTDPVSFFDAKWKAEFGGGSQ